MTDKPAKRKYKPGYMPKMKELKTLQGIVDFMALLIYRTWKKEISNSDSEQLRKHCHTQATILRDMQGTQPVTILPGEIKLVVQKEKNENGD